MNLYKKFNLIAFWFWTWLVFFLIATPIPVYNGTIEKMYDKIAHFLFFGIFSFLLALVLYKTLLKTWQVFLISFLSGTFYAALCEFVQYYVPGRDVAELDFIAGLAGALSFSLLAIIVSLFRKPRLLLHICCVGCGVYVAQELNKKFDLTLYFYNPNIFPLTEYEKRLEENRKIVKQFKLKVIEEKYDHESWLKKIKGHENDPEKGQRCLLCYEDRLLKTATFAKDKGFDYFGTTLTTSPHKLAEEINRLGGEISRELKISFLEADYKKNDGFKKSSQLSKDLGLYRQDYCGCEFSIKKSS